MNTPSPLLYLVQFALTLGTIAGIALIPHAVHWLGVVFGVICAFSCFFASLALAADAADPND